LSGGEFAMQANDDTKNSKDATLSTDYLIGFEQQLKDLWSQYIAALDRQGQNESVNSLRDRYFRLYRNYRNSRQWRKAIANNQKGGPI
jgi:hypothetical protein